MNEKDPRISQNEIKVKRWLDSHLHFTIENETSSIEYAMQECLPIMEWPWKTDRSIYPPTVDFNIRVTVRDEFMRCGFSEIVHTEVKGFMTIEVLCKTWWYLNNVDNYYLLQVTEKDWPISVEEQLLEITRLRIPTIDIWRNRLNQYIRNKYSRFGFPGIEDIFNEK